MCNFMYETEKPIPPLMAAAVQQGLSRLHLEQSELLTRFLNTDSISTDYKRNFNTQNNLPIDIYTL